MSHSSARRAALVIVAVFVSAGVSGCSTDSEPTPRRQPVTTTIAPAATTSTTEQPPEERAPEPDPDARSWPLPKLGQPRIDQAPDPDDAEAVAAAWVQLVATRTGNRAKDAELAAEARRWSVSDDTLRVQLLGADAEQTARIVDATELAPSASGGVVVAVVVDVGPPGSRPTVATVRLRLERTDRWLVAEVLV